MNIDVDWEYDREPGCRCGSCYTHSKETIIISRVDDAAFTAEQFNELEKLLLEWAEKQS